VFIKMCECEVLVSFVVELNRLAFHQVTHRTKVEHVNLDEKKVRTSNSG